jgi:hypothetical protein
MHPGGSAASIGAATARAFHRADEIGASFIGLGAAGRSRATYVPDPGRPSTYPSAYNSSNATSATLRAIPRTSDIARVDGNRAPGASTPSPIARRNASATCW